MSDADKVMSGDDELAGYWVRLPGDEQQYRWLLDRDGDPMLFEEQAMAATFVERIGSGTVYAIVVRPLAAAEAPAPEASS